MRILEKVISRKVFIILFLLALLSVVGCKDKADCEGSSGNKKKKVVRFSYSHQANFSSEIHTAAWIFKNYVADHSDTLEIKLYASGALGAEREIYEGIQLGGGADCIISGTAIVSNFNQKLGIVDLPFLWKDYEHVHEVLDGKVGEILADELDKQGFKVLAWMDSWGYRNIVVRGKQINSPDDIKSLKIRTIQTPNYIQALKAMGTNVTPMAFSEVYSSMQTGVLDGFEHNASVIYADKFYEVADNIVMTRHLFGPLVFVYSKAQWDKLSEAERGVVQEAATFARDCQRSLAPLREEQALEMLKAKGMKITEIDTAGFIKNAILLQDDFAKKNKAEDLLDIIRKTAD